MNAKLTLRVIGAGVACMLLTQTGCSLGLRDAVRSGVYDFVTQSVTDLLTSVSPSAVLSALMSTLSPAAA